MTITGFPIETVSGDGLVADLKATRGPQGTAIIKNKWVATGMVLSKSATSRTLHLSQSGTVGTGISRAKIDGIVVALPDVADQVAVPTNFTGAAIIYTVYLVASGGAYAVQIGETVPDAALALYTVTVPAGDAGTSLAAVTLADVRTIQPARGWVTSVTPFVSVALAADLPSTNYAVAVDVLSATDLAAVGAVTVYDKAVNGFKIKMSGSADNVSVRWTVLKAPE
ncbi:hypothetical protein C8J27_11058 [Rhodobacter aestuarii]|uniref:Uncharacterized protein n=1 Tax=Rhodobacter aestuarii TaxID=453582 RepID=A0A1N7Q0N9_9RHOB|nr:hypothetical protein [Rhodobacter aestuarii]PTV94007.1 hypothetical protein C8J27_11058 [Rhodobacter aestuarii]SIT16463.1 hypothetical protein SAMN05421580_11258 [Rhodobacter aestuarii]